MRMPSSEQRVKKITERAQGNLKGDVMESRLELVKKSTGTKRGPYKRRLMRVEAGKVVNENPGAVRLIRGVSYHVLRSGNLLKEAWKDIFY